MSLPPPPNPYGGQPSYGGQPPYGQPQWGGQPPAGGGAGEGQFSGPPPWGAPPQQTPWGAPPPAGPPPGKGGKGKWVLGGVILLLVIALAVTITVLVVKPDSNGPSATPTNGANSEFASANDTGPVNIITEDPTCDAWRKITNDYVAVTGPLDWDNRDISKSSSEWTPDERATYDTVKSALVESISKSERLPKLTPHRAMRELYEQYLVYTQSFVDRILAYKADDNKLLAVSNAIGNALTNICSSLAFNSAQTVAPLIQQPPTPNQIAKPSDDGNSKPFVSGGDSACGDIAALVTKFDADTSAWRAIDPQQSASDWTPEQRNVNDAVVPVMRRNADDLTQIGARSSNPVFADFATLAAQYRRAFAVSVPDYTAADNYLSESAGFLVKSLNLACEASR